jgi:hypothetical protein
MEINNLLESANGYTAMKADLLVWLTNGLLPVY